MGKISNIIDKMSIRKSIVCYMFFFVIVAIILCALTSYICNILIQNINNKYYKENIKYYLTTEDGVILGGDGNYIYNYHIEYSKTDEYIIHILEVLPNILNPTYSIICVILAIIVFYNNKLKQPLLELDRASNMIANNNLDFSIEYKSADEMGKLCESFEKMRSALLQNNKEIWRQVEERKRLNSAFAHELRTPLTILKGYNEILSSSNDMQIRNTVKVMEKNVDRMERYIDNMSKMQKLEEISPKVQKIQTKDFFISIKELTKVLCNNKINIEVKNDIDTEVLYFDLDMIIQVFNNLLSNSIRYANNLIQVEMKEDNTNIYIIVKDDGKGFSKKALENATNPYYSESKENTDNFGLGLYISKIYCELNNGKLELYNEIGACAKISLKKYKK